MHRIVLISMRRGSRRSRGLRLLTIVATLPLWFLVASTANGQVFDAEAYRQLADASSSQTLPEGTTITLKNWTKYRAFIPVGFQIAYNGKYPMKIGSEPDYTIEVSPPHHFSLAKKYLGDTEQNLGREQLVPSAGGGYTLSPLPGKSAGLPFGTDPTEPNLGYKVMYNNWLIYWPPITHLINHNFSVDRYRNVGWKIVDITFYHLSHLSDPGLPAQLPYAGGYLYTQRSVVVLPEQARYNTSLKLWPIDPAGYPDVFNFVPSERRPMRHSTAARCRPFPGNDFLEDDISLLYPNFKVTYLGLKRLLMRIQDPAKAFDSNAYNLATSLPGWPKAGTGSWELRTHYLIDVEPLPGRAAKCYAHKVMYIDKETWVSDLNEMYDADGRFWKLFWPKYTPISTDGQDPLLLAGASASSQMLDFQKDHASISVQHDLTMGEKVPQQYRDAERLGFPAALMQVNQ